MELLYNLLGYLLEITHQGTAMTFVYGIRIQVSSKNACAHGFVCFAWI